MTRLGKSPRRRIAPGAHRARHRAATRRIATELQLRRRRGAYDRAFDRTTAQKYRLARRQFARNRSRAEEPCEAARPQPPAIGPATPDSSMRGRPLDRFELADRERAPARLGRSHSSHHAYAVANNNSNVLCCDARHRTEVSEIEKCK